METVGERLSDHVVVLRPAGALVIK